MEWYVTVLTLLISCVIFCGAESNLCPDGKTTCPSGSTCCRLSNNSLGCCPIENAICCEDSIHCCPYGYTCDVKKGVCNVGSKSVPLLEKIPAKPTSNEAASEVAVVCPGGEGQCPSDHSCCSAPDGDQFHCCPSGYSCDEGVCQETKLDYPAAVLTPLTKKVVKCNQKFACPDRYTCCKTNGGYQCCPYLEAVCCSDHTHCCPRGYTCSPDSKSCSSRSHRVLALSTTPPKTVTKGKKRLLQLILKTVSKEWMLHTVEKPKLSVVTKEKLLKNVICPDGQSECPDGNTCCKLSSGQWGCCPLPNAVCCSDGVHCCPNGYTCNVSAGTCSKGSKLIPMLQKMPASKGVSEGNVVCPDGQSECPDGNTCCKLSSGQWGCCPLPSAVCCSDGEHCCPNGYTCDVSAGTCSKGSKLIPMLEKIPALQRKSQVSIVCPDGQSECPDGNTCCKLSSGQWGCCPLPKAVCCSDGVHCCPNGYTCDVSEGTCSKGRTLIPMLQKTQASKRNSKVGVVCPGGQSECPDGNTCCKLSSGQWGCCPLPNAVCCSDGVHCCPNGYTCNVSAGTCSKGSKLIPMLQKMPASKGVSEGNVVCPDGQSECPDGNTCCKLSSGQWGCCPLPSAVCCSDGEHCCPNGYTCDVSAGTCSKGSKLIPMLEKIPALQRKSQVSIVCPDGQSECPDGNTCCKLSSGQWGCCPLPKAVCCSDGVHCCPNGYTCDVSEGTCSKGRTLIPMLQKTQASKRNSKVGVVCPDGQSECPDGNTCCKLSSGQWGCCPLPSAVCCSDGEHCCPNGYTCDVSAGTCSKGSKLIPMLEKIPALQRKSQVSIVCPDGQSECPDGNTCCKLSSGQWGCCPLPKAVCCSDGVHCCPNGYTCDVSEGTCTKGRTLIPMLQKTRASKRNSKVGVVCPGGQSECPDGNTCCKLSSGQWGCCPLPNAVCCSDGEHCCPNGYTCDVSEGTCSKGSKLIPMLQKMPALKGNSEVSVVCPDGQSECPDGNTCCKLSSGQWGCCPLPKAVCCSDGEHCCPNGYTCDVSAGTCSKGSKLVPMLEKIPALQRKSQVSIVCPDGQSECPDGNTCCKLSSGQWGCCPLPKAVCCSDGVHCCPNGYTCDVSEGTCSKGRTLVPILQKMRASKRNSEVSVVCPDGQSECPDGNTCCKLSSGQWGCCPLPNAVCCRDGEHCCPNGYTCDVSAGTCSKGSKLIPMLQKMPASKGVSEGNVVCPDGQSECPDGNTCCKLSSGQWGCCPLPNAVCCSDGEHCCPNGYTCHVSTGTCSKGSKLIPMLQKIPASKRDSKLNSVICPDGSECPDGQTCCELASGGYGCCPLPEAVCCKDKRHCCPNGYTCNVQNGTCRKEAERVSLLVTLSAAIGKGNLSNVVCPDGQSECPDGNTCCKLSSGQWGCCPLPNAVCCSDGEHCCPNGYTCDVSEGTCSKGSKLISMLQKMPALKGNSEVSVVCPDGQSECPDGSTCCKLSSGQWGCCPLPKAVCCSDGVHCCPNGYTCDVSAGTCSKGSKLIPMLEKIPVLQRKGQVSIVCPDGQSECPDGNTCCKLSSGQWGCCPLPKAVCCSDGEHCCPNGYTCDVSEGTCSKGSKLISMLQKMPALKGNSEVSVVCPDGQSECPDGSTCCKLSSGQWGCCPLPKAVCCSDGEHCCPDGYTCDVSAETCNKGAKSIPMLQKVPASKTKAWLKSIICPGDKVQCPDNETCCKLKSGEYGCCPSPDAVCCSDGEHCCPHGYTCDLSAEKCVKDKKVLALKKVLSKKSRSVVKMVVCPDGQSECPDGNTCCKLSSGQWGCCPLPNAVCCSDGEHCCPNGYTCNVSAGTCSKGSKLIPMLQKMPASKGVSEGNVVCPDGQSECPDGNTCCKLSSGQWGCCPLPNAVCCSDGEHCCPYGYICNVSAGTCYKGFDNIAVLQKMKAAKTVVKVGNVICPDGQSECPDGNTCCKLASGQYGCCPLPDAVCCSDGEHCCPNGYTCDVSAGTCSKGSKLVPMLEKIPALQRKSQVSIFCPDGQSECPDGNTCCKLSSGQWGCCPLPNAVCCSDGEHCCPNGYTCNVSAGTCSKGIKTTRMLKKMPASKRTAEVNIVCPDSQSQCPDGDTCCKLASGVWGCCPLPNAVCCIDGIHCCPEGYTCNVSSGQCQSHSEQTVVSVTQLAGKVGKDVNTVFCPDGESECPDGYTCCRATSGKYGCCLGEDATCCSDKDHCCPKGYTCLSNGTCHQSSEQIVQSVITFAKFPGSVVCPDKKYQCPNGSTCCKVHSGSYGCCPLENAVCCSDDKHCCPEGYACDVKQGKCDKQGKKASMVDNIPAVRMESDGLLSYIECPDGSECLDYETCCELSDERYGCCPLPKAVCCEDREHCCPSGYRCDLASQTCVAGSVRIPMLKKTKFAHRKKTQKVDLEEKLRFTPGRTDNGNPVEDADWL